MSRNLAMDDQPWLVDGAVQVMEEFLKTREARVLEWGAGGSTLWFAARAKYLVSLEHDSKWFMEVMQQLVKRNIDNTHLIWVPEQGRYIETVNDLAWTFDLILVDGVRRNECTEAAIPHLRTGGWLVLDNTERAEEYAQGIALLSGWSRTDYLGDWQTSIFVKPKG